jgi:signal transduction histidine kinase
MRASAASGAGSTGRSGHRGDARPPRADALLTALLVASSLLALATGARAGIVTPPPDRDADAVAVLLVLGQALPLLLVRRHPVPAVAAAATTSLLGDLCRVPPLPADAGILLVLYSGVAQSRDRGRIAALGVLVALLGVAQWLVLQRLGLSVEERVFRVGLGLLVFGAAAAQRPPAAREGAEDADRAGPERRRTEAARALALERAGIVSDLHDVVTHRLTTMVVQADAAQTRLDERSAETAASLAAIAASGREALAELRELLAGLQPEPDRPDRPDDPDPAELVPTRPAPGLADLPLLVDLAGPPGRRVTLTVQGEQHPLPADVQLAMYRIVQESLTNALRHSGDVPTTVTVRYCDGGVELEIDSAAPPTGALPAGGRGRPGRGRRGMRRRVAALGGELTAGPRPDGGYRVLIRLPDPGSP